MTTAIQNQQTQSEYFNLHARGTGFVERISTDHCTINVSLDPEGVEWVCFEVQIGDCNKDFIVSLRDEVAAGKKPAIAFLIGDFYADTYTTSSKQLHARYKGKLLLAQNANESKPLRISGTGLLSNIHSKNSLDQSLAQIYALYGSKTQPGTTCLEIKANSEQADLLQSVNTIQGNRPLTIEVSFEAEQLMVEPFYLGDRFFGIPSEYVNKPGAYCSATLTKIQSITVDGVLVYWQDTYMAQAA